QLARSVSGVHTYRFVHKNIRPETVITLRGRNSDSRLGIPFLLGFDSFRHEQGRTLQSSDCAWEKDLYRHPQRQGHDLKEYYVMQHDIYSLGVCLLEIGLWRSFILYSQDQKTLTASQDFVPVFGCAESPDPEAIKEH